MRGRVWVLNLKEGGWGRAEEGGVGTEEGLLGSGAWQMQGKAGRGRAPGSIPLGHLTPGLTVPQLVPWQDHTGAGREASLSSRNRPVPGAGEHQLPW